MELKNFFSALVLFSFVILPSASGVPVDWWGTVTINGTNISTDGAIVTAHINDSSIADNTDTVGTPDSGYYLLHVSCSSGDNVSFQVFGVWADQTNQSCSGLSNELNLNMTTLANGQSCSYDQACTNGFCVHDLCRSASTYCGDGFCDTGESCSADDSACSSEHSCTAGCAPITGGSGGGTGSSSGGSSNVQVAQTFTLSAGKTKSLDFTANEVVIESVDVTVKDSVVGAKVKVEKESSKPSYVTAPLGNVYEYLKITLTNLKDEDIEKAIINFKVKKTWISGNNIDKGSIRLNRFNSGWEKLGTRFLSEDNNFVYYVATTNGFSIFSVTGQEVGESEPVCGNGICEVNEDSKSCLEDCPADEELSKICDTGLLRCSGENIEVCNEDGTGWIVQESCEYGCQGSQCEEKPVSSFNAGVWIWIVVIILVLVGIVIYFARQKQQNKKE